MQRCQPVYDFPDTLQQRLIRPKSNTKPAPVVKRVTTPDQSKAEVPELEKEEPKYRSFLQAKNLAIE